MAEAVAAPGTGSTSTESRALGLALMSAAAFGTLAVLAKLGYEAGAGPIPLLAMRFLVAGVLLLAFQKLRGRALAPDMRTVIRLMLLGGLGYGFEASLFFTALTKAPAGVVSLIFFSYPLLTNVLGLATGLETFKPRLALALALGTTGVAFIFSFTTADRTGLLLALGAALAVAVYFLAAQVVMKGVQPAVSATWTSLGAAVATGIAAVVSGQSFPIGALPAAAALGLATVVAFIFLYAAIERIGSSRAAVAQMFEPVVTVVLGALILSEELTWRIAVGAALVVSALPMLTSGGHGDDVPCAPDSL